MNILLTNDQIWSNIHIHRQNSHLLEAQVNRYLQSPLLVPISTRSTPGNDESLRYELPENIRRAADLIRERWDQVTFLQVGMNCGHFHRLFGRDWPGLEKLNFFDMCSGCRGVGLAHVAKLKVFVIEGGPSWPISVATHLTAIELKAIEKLELKTLTEFFRMNTSLETLELTNLLVLEPSGWQMEEPVELPHLNKLTVCDATCGRTLSLLRLPSLKQLRVSSSRGQHYLKHSPWADICPRLPITSLEAHFNPCWKGGTAYTVVGRSNRMDDWSLCFKSKIPGTPLLQSLSNASLSSVTSISFVENAPERHLWPSLIDAICQLLKHLPQVERMRLGPSQLVINVVKRLSGDSTLCPKLRELTMRVGGEACMTVLKLVAGMKLNHRAQGRRNINIVLL